MTTQVPKIRSGAPTVREIEVPSDVRALSLLARVDYADAFVVESGLGQERTAEQWARAMVDDVPMRMQRLLRWSWFALGLKLGAPQERETVLGWEPRRSTPDVMLFGATSRIGMPAEILFMRQEQTLLFATFVQHQNPFARAVWAGVAPRHRRVVRHLLERAGRSRRG